jgi:hypothetical protein
VIHPDLGRSRLEALAAEGARAKGEKGAEGGGAEESSHLLGVRMGLVQRLDAVLDVTRPQYAQALLALLEMEVCVWGGGGWVGWTKSGVRSFGVGVTIVMVIVLAALIVGELPTGSGLVACTDRGVRDLTESIYHEGEANQGLFHRCVAGAGQGRGDRQALPGVRPRGTQVRPGRWMMMLRARLMRRVGGGSTIITMMVAALDYTLPDR